MPAEHQHGGEQDGGVKELLAHALGHRGKSLGRTGDAERAEDAAGYATADPKAATRCAATGREDNADDQHGFEHFAKDDNSGGKHRHAPRYLTTRRPVVARLKSSKNS